MKITHVIPIQSTPPPGKPLKAKSSKPPQSTTEKPAKKTKASISAGLPAVADATPAEAVGANPSDVAWLRMIEALDAGLVKLSSGEERLQFTCLNADAEHTETRKNANPQVTNKGGNAQATPPCSEPSTPITLLEEQKIALAVAAKPWSGAVIQHVVIHADEEDSTVLKPNRKTRKK